ncbi:unnamed protein product, partial [Adineta steineri]
GIKTVYDAILHGIQLGGNRPHFSFRQSSDQPYKSYTHKQVSEIIKEIGSGIVHIGLKPANETFFWYLWIIIDELCLMSLFSLAIFNGSHSQSAVELIFVDDLQRIENLIEWKDEILTLKTIVCFIQPTDQLIKLANEKQLNLLTLEQLREMGRNNPIELVPPKPTDTAVIMYT